MNVADLLVAVYLEAGKRQYITRLEIVDQSQTLLKARLNIAPDLFVQVYRNDRFDTTNLVLVYGGRRVYARDQLGGVWHRHVTATPQIHDTSVEGRRPVDLAEFLDEVESVLATMGLP
ncbi:MAG: hypothetical protein JXA93_13305 [Anaerolineae bacterium]|nr:hypothetical protein [Anaerolineae bacterium]